MITNRLSHLFYPIHPDSLGDVACRHDVNRPMAYINFTFLRSYLHTGQKEISIHCSLLFTEELQCYSHIESKLI